MEHSSSDLIWLNNARQVTGPRKEVRLTKDGDDVN